VRDTEGNPLYVQGYLIDVTDRRMATEALRESEGRFRTLVSNIPGAIYRCAYDADWTMEFISDEVAEITGYPPSDFVDKVRSYASVIHVEDRDDVARTVHESVSEGRPYVLEYRVVTAGGKVRWVYEKGQAVLGPEGEPLWLDGAIFDVTDRKQIEAERERLLERLVEAERITHFGSWTYEIAANKVTWSDEMFRIWGLDPERFGASYEAYLETVHPDDRALVDRAVKQSFEGGGFDYEYRIVRHDGAERFVHARSRVVHDDQGAPVTMIGTAQDITERKEIEAEREHLLAQERAQNARLRELDRLKDTFVASVSHELRTPLTSISGFLQLVQDGLAGETSEEQRRCLAIAGRNADRLHRLIGDLLFVAQMDAGQLVLEPTQVDLRALAAECLESVRPRAMQAGVEVVLEGDAVAGLQGDPSRLTQLLDNLVSNAIKFSSEGGQVAVRTISENGNVVLEVADHGIGIPAEQQQHLFQRFFRGSNAAERAIQGTGIGLSIVKAIVDAHGGSIAVESREGEGTTFRVAFPLRLPPVAPRPKRVEAA
jgi:PAS domain S-box-containing protein